MDWQLARADEQGLSCKTIRAYITAYDQEQDELDKAEAEAIGEHVEVIKKRASKTFEFGHVHLGSADKKIALASVEKDHGDEVAFSHFRQRLLDFLGTTLGINVGQVRAEVSFTLCDTVTRHYSEAHGLLRSFLSNILRSTIVPRVHGRPKLIACAATPISTRRHATTVFSSKIGALRMLGLGNSGWFSFVKSESGGT